MNAYLEILRFGNAVMAAIAVILMMFVGHYYELPIILCALIVFLLLELEILSTMFLM